MGKPFTEEEDAYIAANYCAIRYADIAEKIGRCEGSVASRIKTLGLRRTPKPRKDAQSQIGTITRPSTGVLVHIGNYGRKE